MTPIEPAVSLIVTRPRAQALAWVQALQALRCPAYALPLIDIQPTPKPAALLQAWQNLAGVAAVMFVSANAVRAFFGQRPAGSSWPAGTLAACTGPGTATALASAGLPQANIVQPPADAPRFDSETLWQQLQPCLSSWQGRQVLVVRGEQGRDWLAEQLRAQGAQVLHLSAYRTLAPHPDAQATARLQAALARPQQYVWHFSSSLAIQHLRSWAGVADWRSSRALATHPRIAQTASDAGFGTVEPVAPGVVAAAQAVRGLQTGTLQSDHL